jgi:crossover junction endodeoxyribonuclease RuvC
VLILGIDPGSRYTGWGLLRWEGDRQQLVSDGLLSVSPQVALPARLADLQRELGVLIERYRPDAAAVETPYYGMNPKSLIVLAQARGAILAALASHQLAILEYSPAEVKTAIAGNGRADKKEVARMVRLLLRLEHDGTGNGREGGDGRAADTTDAIAIALCCARRYKLDQLRRTAATAGGRGRDG